MSSSMTQDKRAAKLITPLGKDKILLTRFDGSEGLSELFEYRIEGISKDKNIDFDKIMGKNCHLIVNTLGGGERYFNGILVEAQWIGKTIDAYAYRLVLRPWLWLLSQQNDNFIFADSTAPDIIAQIFNKHGFSKFTNELTRSYPEMEYTVQYRESDMDFVCRLMEQHGISYYFEHSAGGHTLHLCDESSSFVPIDGNTREFIPVAGHNRREKEHFFDWVPERRFTTGKVKLKDYDFKEPNKDMVAEKKGTNSYTNGELEVYDYPASYVDKTIGVDYAEIQLNQHLSKDGHFQAAGDCISCFPGCLMTLEKHPDSAQNIEYLAIRCHHTYFAEDYRTGAQAESEVSYQGSYEFVKSSKTFAPPKVTPKSIVQGPQTGKVVGEGEIDVDEHGRILVLFHWVKDGAKSRRCRLSQVWAGKNWGGIYIPRVGMEVIVEFLEGDPDQPIVIGTVYNGINKPPYDLPAQKNLAGIKSNSTTGGGGYNEYVFDDTKGEELVRQQAEKNMDTLVKNDETRTIQHDRTTTINNDETHTVDHDQTFSIGKKKDGSRTGDIKVNDTLNVGKKIYIEAGDEIKLVVGSSKITMTKTKIKIESVNVEIKASAEFKSSATMSKHSASGIMDIKGSLVKINS